MSDIDAELVREVVEQLTAKTWYDYLPILLSSAAPLMAVAMSFFYFNKQHLQNAKEKIIEKDINRLYEAADLFFSYADSFSLYLSMTQKKGEYMFRDLDVPQTLDEKAHAAADEFSTKISSVFRSYSILRSLGEKDVADKIELYRKDSIDLKKKIFGTEKWEKGDQFPPYIDKSFISRLESEKEKFRAERNICLDSIADCKRKYEGYPLRK
ncbi:MAG: hypothetical protein AB2747_18340 [Candidatus Thiodiazotropha taylori]